MKKLFKILIRKKHMDMSICMLKIVVILYLHHYRWFLAKPGGIVPIHKKINKQIIEINVRFL